MPNDVTARRTVTDALIARLDALEHLLAAQATIQDTQDRVNAHTVETLQILLRRLDMLEEVTRLRFAQLERGKECQ